MTDKFVRPNLPYCLGHHDNWPCSQFKSCLKYYRQHVHECLEVFSWLNDSLWLQTEYCASFLSSDGTAPLVFPLLGPLKPEKKKKRNLLFFQNDVSSERPEDGSYLIKALRQEILKLQPADKNEFLVTYEVREIS